MNPAVTLKERVEGILSSRSKTHLLEPLENPTVLVATTDPAIRAGLTELLQGFSVNTIWLQGVEAAKKILARQKVTACLCGFWLQDGTYRELVRHIRRERIEIPVIIASAPAWPNEYREYLGAMNFGALDFLCFPYQKKDLERMLQLALEPFTKSLRQHTQQRTQQNTSLLGPTVQVGEAA
jgi:DNA-binding NtrC family response regulator